MKINIGLAYLLCMCSLLVGSAYGQAQQESFTFYSIVSDSSVLRVYVGKTGVLARMGHNHVIHTHGLTGDIVLAQEQFNSYASFSFPVSSFVVDDTSERERAGKEFESIPNESAIEGTRNNMLSEAVLNGENFAVISVSVTPQSIEQEQWLFAVELEFQDNTVNLELPAQVLIDANRISIDSRFTINHEDIGLSPFSALGGSLRVAEELDIELNIVATAQ